MGLLTCENMTAMKIWLKNDVGVNVIVNHAHHFSQIMLFVAIDSDNTLLLFESNNAV